MKQHKFNFADFVQVENHRILETGEPVRIWRNALYIMEQDGYHKVIYADGTKQLLHKSIKIRKPQ